ncbi:4'-phosphopantetheinyl transferase family protein [Microlunatus ginsengisoli]|uniref:4'-phosphopantetheinyl transferase superfamily protein n=1 Tax=Microlunatus ginsengisoli TaxID=363863 RepID=A0ABP7AH68_9ACTN
MFSDLLPACVYSVETAADRDLSLLPAEAAYVARAVPKRYREFVSVRACATDALARLGLSRAPLVPGPAGAPRWPPGVIGSMTHCPGFRAAAVGWQHRMLTLGIDAEPNAPLPPGVLSNVARPEEAAALTGLPAVGVAWDRLLFSAKESIYKAWYPLMHSPLGFADAVVTFGLDGSFTATLDARAPDCLAVLTGRWGCESGLVATTVAVDARQRVSKGVADDEPFDIPDAPDDTNGDPADIG